MMQPMNVDGIRNRAASRLRFHCRGRNTMRVCWMILVWVLLFPMIVCATPSWRVGFATVDITPEEPVPMSGYAAREQPSQGVLHRIHAKAMAVEDSASPANRAVLVNAEVCTLHREFADAVVNQITDKTGLQRRQVLINVSHTHSGPFYGKQDWLGYEMPEGQLRRAAAYRKQLRRKLVSIVREALAEMKPARLAWGTGVAHFAMNRREFTEQGVRLGVNPRGYADRSVPVLRVSAPDGSLRGIVFGYACHGTTLGINREISGDYPGIAQHYIEKERPGVQAMFVAGCGGSANPYPRTGRELAQRHGRRLGREVLKLVERNLHRVRGPLHVVHGHASLPLLTPSAERLEAVIERREYHPYNARRMLDVLEDGNSLLSHYRAPIAVWQFGEDLTLVGLSGEVVGEYVPLMEQAVGHRSLWIAAYCNDVFGYLPTARVLEEGGYETRGLFTQPGYFSGEAQAVLLKRVQELAREAGRSF